MAKVWTKEEMELLTEMLAANFSYKEIAAKLNNRSVCSIATKVSRLKLSKPHKDWSLLTKDDLLDLIRIHKTTLEFDSNPDLPGVNICHRILGTSSWLECLDMAKTTPRLPGMRHNKPTIFYVVECVDTNGTIFNKFGITQQPTVSQRYPSKSYKILHEEILTLEEAILKEKLYKESKTMYKPLDRNFYRSGHSGFTECYIDG